MRREAAPLCIDLVRFMDLALRRGERGPQEWLGLYFKSPYRKDPAALAVHDFHRQERAFLEYLEAARAERARIREYSFASSPESVGKHEWEIARKR